MKHIIGITIVFAISFAVGFLGMKAASADDHVTPTTAYFIFKPDYSQHMTFFEPLPCVYKGSALQLKYGVEYPCLVYTLDEPTERHTGPHPSKMYILFRIEVNYTNLQFISFVDDQCDEAKKVNMERNPEDTLTCKTYYYQP